MLTSTTSVTSIPHSRPTLGEGDLRAMAEVLESGFIAQGEKVTEFEQEIAGMLGVRGGVATSSGTATMAVNRRSAAPTSFHCRSRATRTETAES